MQYEQLGNNQVKVSKIALGTWQFGGGRGWGSFDIKEGEKIIDLCVNKGVNFIDTAEGYGESEEILGKLLKNKRKDFFIATKLSPGKGINKFDYSVMKPHIENSLKKLQTDHLDLYQIHWPKMKHLWHKEDMQKKDYEDIFDAMSRLKKEGLIRFSGVSNFRIHHLKEFAKEALDFIVSDQVPYSVLWRSYDVDGTAEFCSPPHQYIGSGGEKNNISFLAYSPLAEGLLTGRFNKNTEIQEGVRKANVLFNEPLYSRALEIVEEIKNIANQIGATPAQVALKWAMEKEIVATVIVGARKLEHFEENVRAVDINLSPAHINNIDKLSLEFQNKHLLPTLELWIGNCRQEDLDKYGLHPVRN